MGDVQQPYGGGAAVARRFGFLMWFLNFPLLRNVQIPSHNPKVAELKAVLETLGLDGKGKKAQLIARIKAHAKSLKKPGPLRLSGI